MAGCISTIFKFCGANVKTRLQPDGAALSIASVSGWLKGNSGCGIWLLLRVSTVFNSRISNEIDSRCGIAKTRRCRFRHDQQPTNSAENVGELASVRAGKSAEMKSA